MYKLFKQIHKVDGVIEPKCLTYSNLFGPNNDDPRFFENIYNDLSTLQAI